MSSVVRQWLLLLLFVGSFVVMVVAPPLTWLATGALLSFMVSGIWFLNGTRYI